MCSRYEKSDSDICLEIEREALLEFLPVRLVPLVFLLAAGATVGAGLPPEVTAANPADSLHDLLRHLPHSFSRWWFLFLSGINCKTLTGTAGKGFHSRRV